MTDKQFEIIEKYLKGFKSQLETNNPNAIKEDTNAIWDLLKEQNEKIEKLNTLFRDRYGVN